MPPTNESQILADLRCLGISDGDVLMVHASLRAVGPVEGGPISIARALQAAVGSAGTILAYVSWEHSPYDATLGGVRLTSEEEAAWPEFGPMAPAYAGFGALNSFLLQLPGARRSLHPDASFLAVGARADWLVYPHELGSGYGAGSPLERFVAAHGKVLLLGASLDAVTVLHFAEAEANIPGKRQVAYRVPDPCPTNQPTWIDVTELDSNGILDVFAQEGSMDAVETIAVEYVKENRHIEGSVGQAHCFLFDAQDIVKFGIAYLESRFHD